MKLAFCLFKYFPFGGLQRDFINIANECARRGHQVDVFTREWQGECPKNFNLHIIPTRGIQNHTLNYTFAKNCIKAFRAKPYHLLIGFNKIPALDLYYAADICYQARIKNRQMKFLNFLPRYRRLLAMEKNVFMPGKKTRILILSAQQKSDFIKYYQTEEERFYLLPPGIQKDQSLIKVADSVRINVRRKFNLDEKNKVILLVGSGFKTKGLDRAIQALASLPDNLRQRTVLWVIGEDKASSFIRLAKELNVNDRIHFMGGREDVPTFMVAADLLIHPAYHENTGTVLLEALVYGLPVLTTDTCGYAHYVSEVEAGCVLKSPFNQLKLNRVLQDMLFVANVKRWQQNGLAFAEREEIYSLSKKAVDYIESMEGNILRDTLSR